ncbi:MAG: hypothetical protein C4K49_07575 [Candidatus Thorarchaeota archaeon]|nr:MAG: hypothetical protein C4K49_07575 [Candidatus Thorarchaeota archaeon]
MLRQDQHQKTADKLGIGSKSAVSETMQAESFVQEHPELEDRHQTQWLDKPQSKLRNRASTG